MAEKEITYDIEGYEVVTNAIMNLLNDYPDTDDRITFNSLSEEEGTTMYPTAGAVVINEKTDVIGVITQKCNYPFMVIYRASGLSEKNRIRAKEMLDNLGKWLEKQKVVIGNEEYKLSEYPSLTNGRKILSIKRTTPAYLYDMKENRTEEWSIAITLEYEYSYTK